MFDGIIQNVESVMGSPWVYVALFAFAAIDAFFPVVPSESLVIAAGVFSATGGEPTLVFIILAAALGAFVGDHISYAIGRFGGTRVVARLGGKRSTKALDWATRTLARRGGLILVVARYIPGGRTVTTLTCGTTRFPLRKFSFYDAIAGLSWGTYSAMIGYIGGHAFEDDPLRGLLVGFGVAIGITVAVELIRYLRERRSSRESPPTLAER